MHITALSAYAELMFSAALFWSAELKNKSSLDGLQSTSSEKRHIINALKNLCFFFFKKITKNIVFNGN